MYNISFFNLSQNEQKYLENKLKLHKDFSIKFHKTPINPQTVKKAKDADIVASFVYSKIDREVIDKMPKLKFIATMSTGFDHIDLEYCKEKNISVSNVPVYGEKTVAEHTFALLLSLSRKIPQSIEKVKKLDFELEDIRGFDLEGKTLGLIGIGHIGANVAKIAQGFDMKVIASDPKPDKKTIKKFNVKMVDLETLLKNSDIISLHAPYNQNTHHLINKDNIEDIKPGSYIINTARGGLIDTDALVYGIEKKIIAGAGLDVLEEEYLIREEEEILKNPNHCQQMLKTVIQNHLLLKNPKVIITPHNAFNSKEALQRILDTTIENIDSFTKGKKKNIVK